MLLAVAVWLAASWPGYSQDRYQPQQSASTPAGIPYTQYFTRDQFGRRIAFYVSGEPSIRRPLVVVVLGSGPFSNFRREGDGIVDAHGTVRAVFAGRAQVMVVEKPGVEFLEQPGHGDAHGIRGSPAFQAENALPRWVEAVSAGVRAARRLPSVDPGKTLLIGHSEGALVAALVARSNGFVTHVASLAGSGPPVTFELELKAREARLYPEFPGDPERQMETLRRDLEAIRRHPKSTTRTAIGHLHVYWSARLKASTIEALSNTRARVFLAHGTADRNVSFGNFLRMAEALRRRNRDITELVVEGADHGFRVAAPSGPSPRDAWGEVIGRLGAWFGQ